PKVVGIRSGRRPASRIASALLDEDELRAAFDGVAGTDEDLAHLARAVGRELVFHLHRLDDDEGRAGLDLFAGGDEHLHDAAGHGGDDDALARAARAAASRRGCAHALALDLYVGAPAA